MSSRHLLSTSVAAARRTTMLASAARTPATTRTLTQTSTLFLKETSNGMPSPHHSSPLIKPQTNSVPTKDNPDPDHYEKHKQDSVQKAKSGKGHWKPELASNSEESIKADRESPKESDPASMRKLQDRTKQAAEELSKHGTSMKDGL